MALSDLEVSFGHALARFEVIEETLHAMLNQHPERERIVKAVRVQLLSMEAEILNTSLAEPETVLTLDGYDKGFLSIFGESRKLKDADISGPPAQS